MTNQALATLDSKPQPGNGSRARTAGDELGYYRSPLNWDQTFHHATW